MSIEELVKSVDIVEYISQFIELEQKGEEFWGLSCFKKEKTPSFSVRREPALFYDFSSGEGGNILAFIKRYYSCTYDQAVEILKKYACYDGEVSSHRRKMHATVDCRKFAPNKTKEKQDTSTILPESCMDRYEKRQDKLEIWRQEGISDESLEKFQVRYDVFSDRLVYPIRNIDGNIVNIGGRTLNNEWKSLNIRKYTYFYNWGTINTMYGVSENMKSILSKKEIIVFEGCKSVLLANTYGIDNTVAILTSHLSQNQLKLLIGLSCRVVFALDKDVCIRADKNIRRLNRYLNVEYLWDKDGLLEDKDSPIDRGEDVFRKLYEGRLRM